MAAKYVISSDKFSAIPGSPIAYWVNEKIANIFVDYDSLEKIAEPRQGLTTCDNDRFMRFWQEVEINKICFNCTSTKDTTVNGFKWYPYNKGGEPRKWYGNNDYIVNWENDGFEIKRFVESKYKTYSRTVKNIPYYFKKGLTYSAISYKFAVRAYDNGFIFADKGQAVFANEVDYYYLCGLLNSAYCATILSIISPTIDFNCGYIKKIPIKIVATNRQEINEIVKETIKLSKEDYDCFENSWNFKKHPLL